MPGRVGFFSQSGVLGVALLAEAERRGLGLSTFVSAGNRADVSGNDLLQYWQDDPATHVILLYLETFGNPRKFARLARRIARVKPVVAVAAVDRDPALSDVGMPALDPAAVTALFARSGVIRVGTVPELLDVGVLLDRQPLPAGRRVGVVTNSSALGRLAAAACRASRLAIVDGYPRDVGPQAPAAAFAAALTETAADQRVDALVVVFAPPLPGELAGGEAAYGAAVTEAAANGDKPVVATFLAGRLPDGVPAYPSVEEAVRALAAVAGHADWRREPVGAVPELSDVDGTEPALSSYNIAVVPAETAETADAAVDAARRLGFPVALKAAGGALRHRLDLGAVRLNLADEAAVRRAYAEMAGVFGGQVLVQPMVAPGVACVVQAVEDPVFGPIVGFGLGGLASELLGDRAWRPAPLTDRDAAALLSEPRAAPLLGGYRGTAPVDRAALIDLLLRVGRLVDEHPSVKSLTLNPVLARPDGLSVLHAELRTGRPGARPDTGPRRLH